MPTVAATGSSSDADTTKAATQATKEALASLDGKASVGLLFASPKHDLAAALGAASALSGAPVIGCTTAGEFTSGGLTHGGMALMLISSDKESYVTGTASALSKNPSAAANAICKGFAAGAEGARNRGLAHSTTTLLVDGLCGTGDEFVSGVRKATTNFQPIVGGAAGDDAAFKATQVGLDRQVLRDGAVAIHAFGPAAWGIGVGHGLQAASSKMTVTRAARNVLYEIDGKPAFEAYRTHAERHHRRALEPETAGPYMIAHELGVYRHGDLHHARAPLSVGADGSLSLAADVHNGDTICFLDGEVGSMTNATQLAAKEAQDALGGKPAAAVLVFDCICRGMILDREFPREIGAIRQVFGNVPILGFLTYGEIARYKGSMSGWHNTTAVIAAIPRNE